MLGCSPGLEAIDRRTQALMEERAKAAGLPDLIPTRTAGTDVPREGLYWTNPPTTNPAAENLRFDVAGELAEVPARLDRNAAIAAAAIGYDESAVITLDLAGTLEQAQRTAREYRSAEEDYILAAIRLLVEQHRWDPQLFNDMTMSLNGQGDDGRFDTAMRVINELRATQRLPYGGNIEARWITQATDNLRERVGSEYFHSSELAIDANIPLLRGAGMVAQETLIQSERDLIYAARDFEQFRREFLVSIAVDYYRLVQSLAQIQNQASQLGSLMKFEQEQQAKEQAGIVAAFALADAQNQVFAARASLDDQRENFVVQLERFKIRLGLPVETPVRISGEAISLEAPEIDMNAAMQAALEYRLDLQTQRDQVVDARRDVLVARNQILPDLDFSAGASLPSDDDNDNAGFSMDADDASWNTSVTFGLPLDRRTERLLLRQRTIALQQQERSYDEFRDNLLLDVRRTARGIDLARRQLELAEYRVLINERRLYEQAELRPDEIPTRTRLETERDLLDARNARDQADTDLRVAILDFLRESGQLRVASTGTLASLPGLSLEVSTRIIDYEFLFGPVGADWLERYNERYPPPAVTPPAGQGVGSITPVEVPGAPGETPPAEPVPPEPTPPGGP